jgi:hypothetical protein
MKSKRSGSQHPEDCDCPKCKEEEENKMAYYDDKYLETSAAWLERLVRNITYGAIIVVVALLAVVILNF